VVATRRIKPVAAPPTDDTEEIDPDEETLGDHLVAAGDSVKAPSLVTTEE